MKLLSRLNDIKNKGYATELIDILYRYINKVTYFKVLQGMILTVDGIDPQYLEEQQGFEYKFLDNGELLHYAQDPANDMDADFIGAALLKGDKCFGILENGNLASYGWYSNEHTDIDDELKLCFDKKWTYMYKGYTKLDYRGKRLHAYGMAMALDAYTRKGNTGLISYVEANNYRSLRSTARLGYKNFGKVFIIKAFGAYRIRASNNCLPYEFTVTPS